MKNKILEICTNIDDSVDYTWTKGIDGGLIDSVVLVEIATGLMEEFDIEIPYEEIIPDNFNSIDAMVRLVEKYV